jgi:hypothetical protein
MTQHYLDVDGVVEHPGRVSASGPPGPDYMTVPGRWLGPNTNRVRKPIPPEILQALGEESRRLGRMLTDEERNSVYARFE